mgnify:CR=1 FL=1
MPLEWIDFRQAIRLTSEIFQQDAFLPYVEDGTLVFVGATTENPSFELNAALLARCQVMVCT